MKKGKTNRRLLALVLCLAMLFSCVPQGTLPVLAAGNDTVSQGQPETEETTTPTEPEVTTEPTEPEVTTVPTEPEDTTAPTEPEATTEPTVPEDTTAPTEPEVTTEPTQPEDTTAPTEPEATTEPTEPEVDTDSNAAPLGVVQSGTAGENVTWTLTDDGLLTISGEGPMKDYSSAGINATPWKTLRVTQAVVEDGVTSLGACAFYGSTSLEKVTLPESLTAIGDSAFYGTTALQEVTLPQSITTLGKGAFNQSGLIRVTLPNREVTAEWGTFYYCENLTDVIMPPDFTAIGDSMFMYCKSLRTLDLSHVTYIESNAFKFSGIEEANLPALVTMGSESVFSGCSNLRSVTLGNQLTQISEAAFEDCESLKEITIPGSVRTIGESAFSGCTDLQRVVMEEGVTTVANSAFFGAVALMEIQFPVSLQYVGTDALCGCNGLETVILNSQDGKCFAGQVSTQNTGADFWIVVSDGGSLSMAGIAALASAGAVGFRVSPGETMILQDSLQIGTWPMPLGALSAGTYTADSAGNLYRIEDSNAILADCASQEESFEVPATVTCRGVSYTVTAVGGYAFANCSSLTTLTFENPSAITSLEDYAFAGSQLTSINEEDTAEKVLETFQAGVSLGLDLFWNSPLGMASETKPATGDLTVEQNGLRLTLNTTARRPDDTDGTKLCWTGQSASITIQADGTQATGIAEQQIVLYFRFTDPQGGFDGNYEMDKVHELEGGYTMCISRASVPGGYFVVLQQPVAGGTYTFSLPVSYPSGSAGGTLFVSAAITEKDAPLKIPALTDGNFHAVRWETQRNEYTISQTASWNFTLLGDGASDGTYLNSSYKTYTAKFNRTISAPEGNYGQDLPTYIDFSCSFKLPKGVQVAQWLQEAIQKNNYEAYSLGIMIQKADGTVAIIIRNSKNQKNFIVMPQISLDTDADGVQTLVLTWRSYNEVTEGGQDVFDNGFTIQLPQYTFYIPNVEKYNEQNPYGGVVVSTLSATTHYQFSSPLTTKSAACNQSTPLGKSELTLTNSLPNGSAGVMASPNFRQLLELENTGATPYDIGGWMLKETIPSSFYINNNLVQNTLDDLLEAASMDSRYDLEIIIRSATLYKPIESQTYLDVDGREQVTTSLADTAYYTDYSVDVVTHENNSANIVANNVQVSIRSGIEVYKLAVQSASGSPIAGIPDREVKPGQLNQALAEIGYTITESASYEVIWHISEDCILQSGESISMIPNLTGKNTYQYTQQDLLNSYDDFDTMSYAFEPITAYLYNENNQIFREAKAGKRIEFTPEIRLDNEVTALNPKTGLDNLKEGDILQYRARITFADSFCGYEMPLVQRSTGAQVLVVSVAENPDALWAAGLDTVTLEEGEYYVLDRPGTYEGVWIDGEYVAVVTVTEDDLGWNTLLKRYYTYWMPALSGNPVGTYKMMLKVPEKQINTGAETQFFYLRGQAWLNDSPTHRLFSGTATFPIAAFDVEKEIVSRSGDTGVGSEHSAIQAGETVYYRLRFWKKYADIPVTITGEDIRDSLPLALADSNVTWSKENIQITTTTHDMVQNLDSWHIESDKENPNQQYIVWDPQFSMELSRDVPVTLYVALTFPSGENWDAYSKAYASQTLSNTIEVSGIRDSVYQDVWIGGSARLQKGVFANGSYLGNDWYITTNAFISYPSKMAEDARLYYENDAALQRVLVYYVTLYNEGPTKLYLTEMQDLLPKGFSGLGLVVNGKYNSLTADTNQTYSWSISAEGAPLATVEGVALENYRKVAIYRTPDEKTGMEKFTFTRNDFTDISYDENVGLCYLMPGEAIVFGYVCRTNGMEDTENIATNTIAMPCYAYNGATLNLVQEAPSVIANHSTGKPITESPDGACNDGSIELIANSEMDSRFHYADSVDEWLVSSVTSLRDEILPGIEKTLTNPQNGNAGPTQTLTWKLTAHNNGRQPIYGYVITDHIQSPYRFEGKITFSADGEAPWSDTIVLERNNSDLTQVTVIRSNDTNLQLTVDGEPVSFAIEIEDSQGNVKLRIPLQIQISNSEDEGEILSLYFEPAKAGEEKIQALMPGQTLNIELSTKPYTTDLRNKVFLNQAYITPTTQTWSEPVNYGNLTSMVTPFTGAEERLSVRNSAQVITTTGLATTSSKEVTQGDSTAVSTANQNWMLLSDPDGTFTYTLKVTNVSQTQIAKMVLIDNLPEPDDHSTFIEGDPRYSEFKVSLADNPQIQVKLIPQDGEEELLLQGTDYTVGYSNETSFTDEDWQGTTNWSITKDTGTRSLRVIITRRIPANATVSVTFNAKIDGAPQAGQTAWNSFGYAYQANNSWLEAAPLKVGVRMKGAPALIKELQTSTGDAYVAEENQTFKFVIYKGEALTLPENFTEETLKELLADEGCTYTTVSLTVNAGQSITEPYILENCVDETGAPWVWEANQKYTLVELPNTSGMHYVSTNNRMQPSYTFTYNEDQNQRLRVVNAPNTWSILLHKTDSSQKLNLSGAWFAFYSPNVKDQISDEAYDALKPEHREKAAKTLEKDGTTYYLMSVLETDASGNIEWRDLREESYLYLEIQAPEGYSIRDEEATKVTWPAPQEDGAVVTCTVINNTHYALPKTGGMGRWQIPALGLVLCAAVVTVFLGKRRKKAA